MLSILCKQFTVQLYTKRHDGHTTPGQNLAHRVSDTERHKHGSPAKHLSNEKTLD